MAEREVMIKTTRKFCDSCDEMETGARFRECEICGKLLCPACWVLIKPSLYQPIRVCKDCVSKELEEVIKLREAVDNLQKQIECVHKKEIEVVTKIRVQWGLE